MAANQHQAREDSREARWSDWELAMIPSKPSSRRGFERRGENQDGWIHSSIKDAFDGQAQRCGIYEWQARRFDQPNRVVYVGSTCPGKAGGLRKRILQYCTNGSHKQSAHLRYKIINVVSCSALTNDSVPIESEKPTQNDDVMLYQFSL